MKMPVLLLITTSNTPMPELPDWAHLTLAIIFGIPLIILGLAAVILIVLQLIYIITGKEL